MTKLAPLCSAVLLALACSGSLASEGRARPSYNNTAAASGNGPDNVDWTEEAIGAPPAFSTQGLIMLEMPAQVSVQVGVDPQTIAVGGDGVVRYVLVMRNSSGSTSAVYEGIRCITDEVKTYARLSSSGQWSVQQSPPWKAVNDNMPSRHAYVFARQGGCQNRLATSPQEIIRALKQTRKPPLSNGDR